MLAPPRPPVDPPEDLIPEARTRQRRRRMVAAALVAAAAALALGAYALAGGFGRAETTGTGRGPGGVPLCRSSQIALVPGEMIIGPLRGRQGLPILENTSSTACALPQYPPRARITWRGRSFRVTQHLGRGVIPASWLPLRAVRVLPPRGKAAISLEWDNWCGAPHSYRPMTTAHLRFDRALAVAFLLGPRPACIDRGAPSTVKVSRPLLVR